MSVLWPAGEAAHSIAALTWFLIGVSVIASLVVIALTGYALFHRGERSSDPAANPEADRRSIRWIVFGGVLVPGVILLVIFGFTMTTLNALSSPVEDAPLVVELDGKQWWWQVTYEAGDRSVLSANEIHIPAGQRVPLRVTASDVIHSFWVPELHGKIDLIPGRVNTIWLHADAPGVFRGQCAEYCGLQHALMGIVVIAHDSAAFEAWLARESAQASPDPTVSEAAEHAAHGHGTLRGREIFEREACGMCHTIRGTGARGTIGPDLTHIGSRRSLAAGTLPNTRGNLAGWIANPQAMKPGARMPRIPLPPDDLHALVNYLMALR